MIAGNGCSFEWQFPDAGVPAWDERLIKLTAAAADKVSSLLQRQGRPTGVLRVAVVGGGMFRASVQDGSSGPPPEPRYPRGIGRGSGGGGSQERALRDGFGVLDYLEALQGGGFKVTNPNAATSCSLRRKFLCRGHTRFRATFPGGGCRGNRCPRWGRNRNPMR